MGDVDVAVGRKERAGVTGRTGTVPPGSLPVVLETMIIGAVKLSAENSPRDSVDKAEDAEETMPDCSKALETLELRASVKEMDGRVLVINMLIVAVAVWTRLEVFKLLWRLLSCDVATTPRMRASRARNVKNSIPACDPGNCWRTSGVNNSLR